MRSARATASRATAPAWLRLAAAVVRQALHDVAHGGREDALDALGWLYEQESAIILDGLGLEPESARSTAWALLARRPRRDPPPRRSTGPADVDPHLRALAQSMLEHALRQITPADVAKAVEAARWFETDPEASELASSSGEDAGWWRDRAWAALLDVAASLAPPTGRGKEAADLLRRRKDG